jgi:hypothetical protein
MFSMDSWRLARYAVVRALARLAAACGESEVYLEAAAQCGDRGVGQAELLRRLLGHRVAERRLAL